MLSTMKLRHSCLIIATDEISISMRRATGVSFQHHYMGHLSRKNDWSLSHMKGQTSYCNKSCFPVFFFRGCRGIPTCSMAHLASKPIYVYTVHIFIVVRPTSAPTSCQNRIYWKNIPRWKARSPSGSELSVRPNDWTSTSK